MQMAAQSKRKNQAGHSRRKHIGCCSNGQMKHRLAHWVVFHRTCTTLSSTRSPTSTWGNLFIHLAAHCQVPFITHGVAKMAPSSQFHTLPWYQPWPYCSGSPLSLPTWQPRSCGRTCSASKLLSQHFKLFFLLGKTRCM